MDIWKASRNLDSLNIKINLEGVHINVLGFRSDGYKENWKWPRHKHSFYELHFIADGRDHIKIDDQEFTVKKGDFYVTAPDVYHEQYSYPEDGLVEYGLQCEFSITEDSTGGFEPSTQEFRYLMQILNKKKSQVVRDRFGALKLFNKALEEAYFQRPGYFLHIKTLIVDILIAAARDLGTGQRYDEVKIPKKNQHEWIIEKVNYIIHNNCSKNMGVKDIAALVYLSDKQLNRIVRQNTGKSLHEYVTTIRLQHVKNLLKSTDYTLREIADLTGFANEFHLSRVFKQYIGINTTEYKKGRIYNDV